MLNHLEIVARIEKFRQKEELSAAAFAQKIGVPRSSLSHLISGRNKPSLDLLVKITTIFPQLSLDELVYGTASSALSNRDSKDTQGTAIIKTHIDQIGIAEKTEDVESEIPSHAVEGNDDPEQLILLYKDGSFKSYSTKS